ncbi:PEP-utilizing enzyme [Pseudonocardia hispaniensis]|uniref:PEP-utilizing enzyme n=1 Tax=Pseudonocardia hispaniensis TaxID=904933 RepID=A0ABW1IZE5_9PSEU
MTWSRTTPRTRRCTTSTGSTGATSKPDSPATGAGRAAGRVRLVHGPVDSAAFGPDEILAAKATAPAWTSLFARAAAVVTDGGTLAAHASLVAREYGIPAVVGTGDATARLRAGDMITVDGTTGIVTPATGR